MCHNLNRPFPSLYLAGCWIASAKHQAPYRRTQVAVSAVAAQPTCPTDSIVILEPPQQCRRDQQVIDPIVQFHRDFDAQCGQKRLKSAQRMVVQDALVLTVASLLYRRPMQALLLKQRPLPGNPSTSLTRLVHSLEPSDYIHGLPVPSGRKQAPCWLASCQGSSAAGTAISWPAAPAYVNVNANVSPIFAGLSPVEMAEVARTFFGATQEAVDAATETISADPHSAAEELRGLLALHSHALSLVGPGGASALAVVDDRLHRLLGEIEGSGLD